MTGNRPIGDSGEIRYNPTSIQSRFKKTDIDNNTYKSVFEQRNCKFGENDRTNQLIHNQYWGNHQDGQKTGLHKVASDFIDSMNEMGTYVKHYRSEDTSIYKSHWDTKENANRRFETISGAFNTVADAGKYVGTELARFFDGNSGIVEASERNFQDDI